MKIESMIYDFHGNFLYKYSSPADNRRLNTLSFADFKSAEICVFFCAYLRETFKKNVPRTLFYSVIPVSQSLNTSLHGSKLMIIGFPNVSFIGCF